MGRGATSGNRPERRLVFVNTLFSCLATVSESHSFTPIWQRPFFSRLWLHNSGTGEFGYADLEAGKFVPVAFCPGYLRGLSFVGDFAVMGLSKPRENRTFKGLALDDALAKHGAEARCALQVVDLRSGDTVHWLRIEGVVEELYDVVVLPGVRRPMALGFKTDEIRRMLTMP